MPTIISKGVASAQGFGSFLGGTVKIPINFISTLGAGLFLQGTGVKVDSANDFYVCGYKSSAEILLIKYTKYGTVEFQKSLSGSLGQLFTGITIDPSGNIYACGIASPTTGAEFNILVVKYNSAGVLQWKKSTGGTAQDDGWGISTDTSGNIYVAGDCDYYYVSLIKYDSSGSILWQKRTGNGSGTPVIAYSCCTDPSDKPYICGKQTSTNDIYVAGYGTDGTISFQSLIYSSGNDTGYSITAISSNAIFVCGTSNYSGNYDIVLMRLNSTGAITWQRKLSSTGIDTGYSVALDLNNDIFICGVSNNNQIQLACYNASGVIQWQRNISCGATITSASISLDSLGKMVVTGKTNAISADNGIFVARLPSDGSKTGTYTIAGVSFTYAASSLTDAAGTMAQSSVSYTNSDTSFTNTDSALTSGTSSYTLQVATV